MSQQSESSSGNAQPPSEGAKRGFERFSDTRRLQKDLKGKSVRGGAATVASRLINNGLRIAALAVMARLLKINDFGLVAMVQAIIGFAEVFKDLGLSMATVQKKDITHEQVSTLFWINAGVGLATGLVFAAASPLIAWFYKEPRLVLITCALASSFLLAGLTTQHRALMRRQMRFSTLAGLHIASMAIGYGSGILFSFLGFGYWSIVIMQLATPASDMVLVWMLCGWVPGLPRFSSGVGSMLSFGGNLSAFRIVNYFGRNVDNILIGRRWGSNPLALYTKAYSLLLLPLQQINAPLTAVAVPSLSRLQNKPEEYKRYYFRGVLLGGMLVMPTTILCILVADKAILLVLGDKWLDAVPIFRLLGVAAFLNATNIVTGWAYVSLGRVSRQLKIVLVSVGVTVLAVFCGLRYGAVGVAAAISVKTLVWRPVQIWICYQGTFLRISDLLATLWRPAVASIGAGAALFGLMQLWEPPLVLPVALVLNGVEYAALYLLAWAMLPNGRKTLRETVDLYKEFRLGPKKAKKAGAKPA